MLSRPWSNSFGTLLDWHVSLPAKESLTQIVRSEPQHLAHVYERESPVSVIFENPGARVGKTPFYLRIVVEAVLSEIGDRLIQNRSHQFMLWKEVLLGENPVIHFSHK